MARKRPIRQSDISSTPAVPQAQLRPSMISLRELITERKRFDTSPPYQRQQVWPLRWGQQLVDSILLGDPIGRFEGHEVYNEKGEMKWCVDDGRQRFLTILAFHDGKFKTMTVAQKLQSEPGAVDSPVEPGKYFHELSVNAQNHFLNYHIQIDRTRPMSEEQRLERFLRIQNQAPLSAGERLNVYNSKAKAFATRIEEHSFWRSCYRGRTNRQQAFQSSLYLLALEMTDGGFLNLRSGPFIKSLASGKCDQSISDDLVDAVITRLDVVAHVYNGIQLSERAILIAMYQSILFLEQTGYTVQPKDKGSLTTWASNLLAASKHMTGIPRHNQPFYRLLYESGQREFWDRHLNEILRTFAISRAPGEQVPPMQQISSVAALGKPTNWEATL